MLIEEESIVKKKDREFQTMKGKDRIYFEDALEGESSKRDGLG